MCTRKLADPSINYILLCHFFRTKNFYFKCARSHRDATEGLRLPETNTKMPTIAKNVDVNKIVTNSEIHLHNCLCESRGFKIGRRSNRRCSMKKGILENCAKVTRKTPVSESLF